MNIRLTDPKGIVFEFEGSQVEFEKLMEKFDTIQKYMAQQRREAVAAEKAAQKGP